MIEEKLEKRISQNNEFGEKNYEKKRVSWTRNSKIQCGWGYKKKMKEKKNKKCQKFGMLMMV